MAKIQKKVAKKTSEIKGLVSEFIEKSLGIILSAVASIDVIGWIKGLSHLREKIRKLIAVFILMFIGTLILVLGLADYAAYIWPNLKNGLSHIILGSVLIISAMIIHTIKR